MTNEINDEVSSFEHDTIILNTAEYITKLIQEQRQFFVKGTTLAIDFRKEQLKKLQAEIKKHESEIMQALKTDLNKSVFAVYATEIGLVYEEIKYMLEHIDKFSKRQKVQTAIRHFPAKSYVYKEPYGSVLIMSPWNYPFQLALIPLVAAMATGNCAIVKPSNYSTQTSAIITKILSIFDPKYIAVLEDTADVNKTLLDNKFDYIFFTGSTTIGKLVMQKASRYLTPITLELGGKSPCIVDETANIEFSAKRIAWGKLLNAGQTCIAPDYILVHQDVKDALIENLKIFIDSFYGQHPEKNIGYPKIINRIHFDRLTALIQQSETVWGGQSNVDTLKIAPALILNADWECATMEDEIFGPILPIITYSDLDTVISTIRQRPKPLSLYLFTTSKDNEQKIISSISYGGGCINDTISHVTNHFLPFGGVGESGIGNYHGKQSFDSLSHSKSVLIKELWMEKYWKHIPIIRNICMLKKVL